MTIPCPDSQNQPVHPDVYDAGAGNTWNGYRYWMAHTPYTNTNSTVEKPCIVVSDDKETWEVPSGGSNPIIDAVRPDSDLVVDGSTMYFINTRDTGATVVLQSSTDGIAWSGETNIITGAGTNGILSPAIVYFGGQWSMFSVRYDSGTPTNSIIEKRTCSTIDGTWSAPATCSAPMPYGYYPWHLDVIVDENILYMALCLSQTVLYLAVSTDGGDSWDIIPGPMLEGVVSTWNVSIYRSTIIRTATGFDLWYSANDQGSPKAWGIGFTTVSYQ